MRIILETAGTFGDLEPFLVLAHALESLGHEPILVIQPSDEDKVREEGLSLRSCGPWVDVQVLAAQEKYSHPIHGGRFIFEDFYGPRILPAWHCVSRLIEEGADFYLGHFMGLGGALAARQAKLPYGQVMLAPCWWLSRQEPSVYGPDRPPRWLAPWLMWLPRMMLRRISDPWVAKACVAQNEPVLKDAFSGLTASAHLLLGLWSRALRPAAKDDHVGSHICGYPMRDPQETRLDAALMAFLQNGSPPVVVGMGTSAVHQAQALYLRIAQVCHEMGQRVVLVGQAAQLPLDGVLCVPYAPYDLIFPRASVVIHHGGSGTMAQVMRAGRPSLVVPHLGDQFDNALRLVRAGAALQMTPGRANSSRVAKMLKRLLEDESFQHKAAGLALEMRSEGEGATRAAEILHQWAIAHA